MAKEKCIVDLFCYYHSLLCINFISAPSKVLCLHCFDSRHNTVNWADYETINHILREGNHCADFMAKFDALLTSDLYSTSGSRFSPSKWRWWNFLFEILAICFFFLVYFSLWNKKKEKKKNIHLSLTNLCMFVFFSSY